MSVSPLTEHGREPEKSTYDRENHAVSLSLTGQFLKTQVYGAYACEIVERRNS
jgi:hypothetical protein